MPADRSSVVDDPRHSRQRTALPPPLPLRTAATARQASHSVAATCWTRARAGLRALVTRSSPGKTFTPANGARSSPCIRQVRSHRCSAPLPHPQSIAPRPQALPQLERASLQATSRPRPASAFSLGSPSIPLEDDCLGPSMDVRQHRSDSSSGADDPFCDQNERNPFAAQEHGLVPSAGRLQPAILAPSVILRNGTTGAPLGLLWRLLRLLLDLLRSLCDRLASAASFASHRFALCDAGNNLPASKGSDQPR